VLYHIAGKRLAAGRLTVVDATNVQPESRRRLVQLARANDVLPVAIVFDLPERVCVDRNAARPDRDFPDGVIRRQRGQLRRSLRGLRKEGFRTVHVLSTVDEVDAATVVREPLRNDLRHRTGPFDVIGDVHGCRAELVALLTRLGYVVSFDGEQRAVDAVHPDGRSVVFVGDLVDRGPDSPGVLRLAMGMVAAGHALAVPGNHENKLVRALDGRTVRTSHGLAQTLEQLAREPEEFRGRVHAFCRDLVSHLVLDGGRLVVAHAGLKESYHGRASGRVRSFALYGDTTGETDEFGLPVRYPWANDYRGTAMVLYGHTPTPEPTWVNNTMCLDTGCVFGGRLTALRYPEREVVSVPAEREWYPPVRPLVAPVPQRAGDVLDITDVLGKRAVETAYHGRITVREESAAGALEVMSRFALEPRWLCYLPPTMAPCATSALPDFLEHPAEAFASYLADGVSHLICEEKHMGSRAVLFVTRDGGVVHTRTGRSFFGPERTADLLRRLRSAIDAAGLWTELGTDRLLLDSELLPWSAKAEDLLRHQYAAVGAAARTALPAAVAALTGAVHRGQSQLAELLDRTRARAANAEAYTAAYRRYCWPVDGLDGVRIAPFQVLASAGATYHDRDHGWHLAIADRLVAADPELFWPTRRIEVDASSPGSVEAATAWWTDLTAQGGEGMVVKPLANLVRNGTLVQPGIKVRGREYLRIIYGPDYTEPANLTRLRQRGLGHKRSLALREYALGLEALERTARGEPLHRVHEAVFAILALESEPVDPRL
jgi:protein phosphatase